MSCPVNQCNRTNPFVDSQGIRKANKDLVKHYDAEPLPTLIGKPERIAALNARILEDEKRTNMAAALTRGEIPVSPDVSPDVSTAGYRVRFKIEIAEEAAEDIPEAILNTIQVCPSNDFIIPEEILNENKHLFVTVATQSPSVPMSAEVTNDCDAVAMVSTTGVDDLPMVPVLINLGDNAQKDIEVTLFVGRTQQNPDDDQPK